MREIKFRGKRIDNGELVYGYYAIRYGNTIIWNQDNYYHEVDPETVGQYTGLKDKTGKEWIEGDKTEGESGVYAVVVFEEGSFCFAWYEMTERNGAEYIETTRMTDYHYDNMEIIGNIHEEKP